MGRNCLVNSSNTRQDETHGAQPDGNDTALYGEIADLVCTPKPTASTLFIPQAEWVRNPNSNYKPALFMSLRSDKIVRDVIPLVFEIGDRGQTEK